LELWFNEEERTLSDVMGDTFAELGEIADTFTPADVRLKVEVTPSHPKIAGRPSGKVVQLNVIVWLYPAVTDINANVTFPVTVE